MNWLDVDLPNLQFISLGDTAFYGPITITVESIYRELSANILDLPSLQSMKLGKTSLGGKADGSCSLTMRSIQAMIGWIECIDLPSLTSIASEQYSFYNIRSVVLESWLNGHFLMDIDIPNLQNVDLPHSFRNVESKSIDSLLSLSRF